MSYTNKDKKAKEIQDKIDGRLYSDHYKIHTLTDDVIDKNFLRKLKRQSKDTKIWEARLRALSFLQFHYPELGSGSTGLEPLFADLQSLLLSQFKRGVLAGRKEIKAKKRK